MAAVIHGLLLVAAGSALGMLAFLFLNLSVLPRLGRPRRGLPDRKPGRAIPSVSIIIPARNEERDVEAAVRSHLAQSYPNFEVVAVDDRSTDATTRILQTLAEADSRLRVIEGVEPPPGWLGKPHALAAGARAASGEILLFADADVRYAPAALSEAVAFLEEEEADFVALFPALEGVGFWESVLMPYLPHVFYCGLGFLANVGWARRVAAGGGAGNLVRRSAYEAIGGHDALKDSVVDDIRLALASKRAGRRTLVVRAEELVRVRMYRGFREVWDGFTKNVAYVVGDASGVVLIVLILATLALAILPVVVLGASLAGAGVPASDVRLAAVALILTAAGRIWLALAIRQPVWPSLFHPILAAVWTGIIGRSFFHRIVRRRLTWRGREYDARSARF